MATGLFTLRQVLQGIRQGAWTGNIAPQWVEYLVVAGGGGGGFVQAGGGGAGGLLAGILPVTPGATLTVTVGGGGAGATGYSAPGVNGDNSVFSTITSSGGGGGGSEVTSGGNGSNGGSGGGAGYNDPSNSPSALPGNGIVGQGNKGGTVYPVGGAEGMGGGGGAGTVGINGANIKGGDGGAGIASAINGTVTTYAGGGGASGTTNAGTGGVGGGGNGKSTSGTGGSGTTNTGGGGGGSRVAFGAGGAGGSGIVIVRYPDNYAAATTATGATISTAGSGSLNFSGTSYLTTTITAIGTSAFTSECWVYVTALPSVVAMLIDARSTDTNGSVMYINSTGVVLFGSGTNYGNTSSATLSLNTWYHVAITRTGGTTTCWVNGSSAGTTTDSSSLAATQVRIGTNYSAVYGLTGYISNARMVNGVAVYTGTFTPSTRPLNPTQSAGTNISAVTGVQTILLLNTVSGALYVDNSSFGLTVTPTNTPTWNQLSPFATGLGYKSRVYTWTTSGTVSFVI